MMFLKICAFEHKTEKLHESNLLCLMAISISVSTTSDRVTVGLAFPFNKSLHTVTPSLQLLTLKHCLQKWYL